MTNGPHCLAPEAQEQVLSTLNRDGSRRWLRPRLSQGRYLRRRRLVAYVLIVLFTAIPYLSLNGKPLVLLDIVHRQFTLFGSTFLATDTLFLMLLALGVLVGIFLITAVFGRVWCGWACPQTVYMEFIYRPLETWIEGGRAGQQRMDRTGAGGRRIVRYGVFVLVSMFLAHTFLAYFVGIDRLIEWVQRSPFEHPTAFLVMAGVTLAMLFDFAFFREQTCLVACPYGRFQSVLLDRRSWIVGYDARRGEPRGRGRVRTVAPSDGATGPRAAQTRGDCIDCHKCVLTCPTGIDIRDGLQMECLHCTQCIDACDAVMDKIGRPRGLIRYTSKDELSGAPRSILRPRVVLYPVVLLVIGTLLVWLLAHRMPVDITVLRGAGAPYRVLDGDEVSNTLRVRLVNRTVVPRTLWFEISSEADVRLQMLDNPVALSAEESTFVALAVVAPRAAFQAGRLEPRLRITDRAGFTVDEKLSLLGPGAAAGLVPPNRDPLPPKENP